MSNCEGNVYHIGMGCCVPKIANPDLYYTKEEVDEKIDDIEVSGVTEEKAEEMIDNALQGYATEKWVSGFTYDKQTIEDMIEEGGGFVPENYYNKTATDALLAAKANTSTTYTKANVNNLLAKKADTATTYTKDDIDIFIDTLETADSVLDGKVNRLATNLETETQRAQNAEAAISGAIPSLDDYATKAYVSGYTYDKQTIDNMIEESGGVIVDSALSTTSENPVQNKVITNAINNLDDGITNLENTFVERIKVPSTISASANSSYMTLNIPYLYGWDNDISYETNKVEFSAATSGSAGVMSADDKTKLDGLLKTWSGTQAEYDAITEKDDNTVYFIKED